MQADLCGVCNEEVPIEHVRLMRQENEREFTSYHMKCESKIPKYPCVDCGKHKLFCSECRE